MSVPISASASAAASAAPELDAPLAAVDPEIADVLDAELRRQRATLDMIASESVAPRAVLECQGSVLTNKYASGRPGARVYRGCESIDEIERLAIARARSLFGAEHANVQPYSGAQANVAVLQALLATGDRLMSLRPEHGGHFTHGAPGNVSSSLYAIAHYDVDPHTRLLDMDEVARAARAARPHLIVAGGSCYPRRLDFAAFRRIADEVGALLMVDMAHVAGPVAAGLYPSPVPHADVVTTTVHKTLGGPRGGLVLCRAELAERIDSAVYPGLQGGPLAHAVAATAVAMRLASGAPFRAWMERTLAGARTVAATIADAGVSVWSGGTDVHFAMADLRDSPIDGFEAERRLGRIGIVTNRNVVPFDPRPAAAPSGLRLGTPVLAARGFADDDFAAVGAIVGAALGDAFERDAAALRARVAALAARHPLYGGG